MFDYGIGGQERKGPEAIEGIADIPQNKTLLVEQLTSNPPVKCEVVKGLESIDKVFAHFKPSVQVGLEKEDGVAVNETFKFDNVGDFGRKALSRQSPLLNQLETESDTYQKIIKELRSNKSLQSMMQNPESREACLSAINAMMRELSD